MQLCNDAKDDAFARGQGLDWIPEIAVNAAVSDAFLNKPPLTGNGRNP